MTETYLAFAECLLPQIQLALCWSLLLAVPFLIRKLGWKLSASGLSWLWRVIYLKLLLALCVPALLSIPVWASQEQDGEKWEVRFEEASEVSTLPTQQGVVTGAARGEAIPTSFRLGIGEWLVLFWSAAALVILGRYAMGWYRASRVVALARIADADSEVCVLARRLQQEMELHEAVAIRFSSILDVPCAAGIFRPSIILPDAYRALDRSSLKAILAHELAHIARRDVQWNLLQIGVHTAFFFHPLLWIFRHDWWLSQEVACDELAVRYTDVNKSCYASLIIGVSTGSSQYLMPPAVLAGASHFPLLRRRLLMLLERSKPARKLSTTLRCSLALAAILLLVPLQLVSSQEQSGDGKAKTAPGLKFENHLKASMKKHKGPHFKVQIDGLLWSGAGEAPAFAMPEGIATSIQTGMREKHIFRVRQNEEGTVKLICLWEAREASPRVLGGQRKWSSKFSEAELDVTLGAEPLEVYLVSPEDDGDHKRITVKIEAVQAQR